MDKRYILTSVTRIADLGEHPFTVNALPKEQWDTGDYVVGSVTTPIYTSGTVELVNGRMVEVTQGDRLIGALGIRRATLEIVGDWQHIEVDGVMAALTEGGLFGKPTSIAQTVTNVPPMVYCGHVMRHGKKVTMNQFVPDFPLAPFTLPVIMMLGTSMSSGKTTTARIIIRLLKQMGFKVTAVKLAGAGQYHDILSMQDAGADFIYDFVDVGLPSTVCEPEYYARKLYQLLDRIRTDRPDIVIAEAGASPCEPYNGSIALRELADNCILTILCAADPYAVLGAVQSLRTRPDFISGMITNNSAGIQLVEEMSNIPTLNPRDAESLAMLKRFLQQQFNRYRLTVTPNKFTHSTFSPFPSHNQHKSDVTKG